jgi:hypothetical protein
MIKCCSSLLIVCSLTLSHGADWPRFRGPDGNGVAGDAKPPTTWSESENVKWKTPLPGPGSSSPIISGDRVFVTCYSGYGDDSGEGSLEKLQRHLLCVDRASGKILWDSKVPAELPEDPYSGFITEHGYASSTPVTDGERVYVFFGKTGVLAFDFSGRELWRVNVGKESGNRHWGSGASLVLFQDKVIVNASEESQSIRALDKMTGKEVWKAESKTLELSYGTPALMPSGERTDLVIAVPGEIWGMNPDSGKLRWFASTEMTGNVSPSVTTDDGVIYANGGFPSLGSAAVRGGGKGDVTSTNILWESKDASYVPSPVISGGHLFVVNDQGFALCLDAKDGKSIFRERLPGASAQGRGGKPFYASTVLANGLIYAVSRQNGTFVFEAKPEFKLISQNKLAGDDSQFNGTPAVVDRQLFLRSNKNLYCLEAK